MTEKTKILVAMSGGVDSSAACALLKEQGYEVGGATMRMGIPEGCAGAEEKACCGLAGVRDAREVATALGIPHWFFNFEREFKSLVMDYFSAEYLKGRTPNPCIACNEHIKFRLFLNRARELGFDAIATGHYAKLAYDKAAGRYFLREGRDPVKDQSYVLFPLDQEVLGRLFLPAGEFTKAEIREKARTLNLSVTDKPDSQEVCFVPGNDYGLFLEREYGSKPETKRILEEKSEGNIRDAEGKILGRHRGYFRYTRGQRRGLGVAHSERLYVIETIPETNEVVVGSKEDILDSGCVVRSLNWFLRPDLRRPFRVFVKIRSQHKKARAMIRESGPDEVTVVFDEPQEAVTSGQAAVFYEGDRVLGGGWIFSAQRNAAVRSIAADALTANKQQPGSDTVSCPAP